MSRERIILKKLVQLSKCTSARTLAFLSPDPTSSGNDLEKRTEGPVSTSTSSWKSLELVANLKSLIPIISLAKRGLWFMSTSTRGGSPEKKLSGVGGLRARFRKLTIFFALRLAARKLRNDMLLGLVREARQNAKSGKDAKKKQRKII